MAGTERATRTESGLTFHGSGVLEAKYKTSVHTIVALVSQCFTATQPAVATSLVRVLIELSRTLIFSGRTTSAAADDINLTSEYRTIHRRAHGLVSIAWVVLQYVLRILHDILSSFADGTPNDGLQLFLGGRVVCLHLSQCLLVLLDAGDCDCFLCHTLNARNVVWGLLNVPILKNGILRFSW